MKYQQLKNLEAGWKWSYLVKKLKEGEQITRYIDSSEIQTAIDALLAIEHMPTKVLEWINAHMATDLDMKIKQAIRAKRKRYYNAEHEHTKKKSIDLDFAVWQKLSYQAKQLDATLSDTIEYLICDGHHTENSAKKFDSPNQKMNSAIESAVLMKLTQKAKEINASLSETVDYLIMQESRSKLSSQQINALKQDLSDLLDL